MTIACHHCISAEFSTSMCGISSPSMKFICKKLVSIEIKKITRSAKNYNINYIPPSIFKSIFNYYLALILGHNMFRIMLSVNCVSRENSGPS